MVEAVIGMPSWSRIHSKTFDIAPISELALFVKYSELPPP
ncbi:type IV secretion protein DotL (plasmid) [Acetobacter orientalis]|uniref:Type IV secretion protein DotL n=1 Tax=Acetobacter orientalis TaxID=146474 RepID=A0A2Z5ZMS9_9PROT|nr:type IV secretion protein DotL [Acetobacter orientalis]